MCLKKISTARKSTNKGERKIEPELNMAVRKEELDKIRGKRERIDPELGPENKK